MKILSGLFVVWVMVACSLSKEKSNNVAELKQNDLANSAFVTGEVTMREGCSLAIRVIDGAEEKKYYPINLSEEYKKEGMKIHFLFHLSRAMQPAGCKVDAVIVIDEIEFIQ